MFHLRHQAKQQKGYVVAVLALVVACLLILILPCFVKAETLIVFPESEVLKIAEDQAKYQQCKDELAETKTLTAALRAQNIVLKEHIELKDQLSDINGRLAEKKLELCEAEKPTILKRIGGAVRWATTGAVLLAVIGGLL